jgi:hypothetical protein
MANTVMPKAAGQRQRRNKSVTSASLEAAPAAKATLEGDHWHPNTLRWWDIIWSSPMAAEWVDADLPSLFRLARLDDRFWKTDDDAAAVRLASEIRQQQMQFGLTPMSRRQLQWEVKRVEGPARRDPVPQATPTERRSRLHILGESRAG